MWDETLFYDIEFKNWFLLSSNDPFVSKVNFLFNLSRLLTGVFLMRLK